MIVPAKLTAIWSLIRGRFFGRAPGVSRAGRSVVFRGRPYRRDVEGRWLDEDGRQPDLDTCFVLADEEKGTGAR